MIGNLKNDGHKNRTLENMLYGAGSASEFVNASVSLSTHRLVVALTDI